MSESELILPGAGESHGELDASHADPHHGTDLEQLEAERAAGRFGKLGVRKADATQHAEQDIARGREPQAELIGAHRGGRGAVGEQIELALLDAVLHFATGAVDHLVETLSADLAGLERGDDEARIGLAAGELRLADDAASAAPPAECRSCEVHEAPRRPAAPDAAQALQDKYRYDRLL